MEFAFSERRILSGLFRVQNWHFMSAEFDYLMRNSDFQSVEFPVTKSGILEGLLNTFPLLYPILPLFCLPTTLSCHFVIPAFIYLTCVLPHVTYPCLPYLCPTLPLSYLTHITSYPCPTLPCTTLSMSYLTHVLILTCVLPYYLLHYIFLGCRQLTITLPFP